MRRVFFAILCFAGAANAQVLNLTGPASADFIRLSATALPSLQEYDLRGIIPISPAFSASVHVGELHLSDGAAFASPAGIVPRNLWSLDFGVTYNHAIDRLRGYSATLGVGTNSDEPFHGFNETALSATAIYHTPAGASSQWLFGLNFSNNRPVLNYIPIPIVAWVFRAPEIGLDGALGFPFAALHYKPDARWDASLSVIATNINAEVGFRPATPLRLYAGYSWAQELWALADRADTSQRLIYDSMKAGIGAEISLAPRLILQIAGGRTFEARFFEGTGEFDRVVESQLNAGWYGTVTLRIPFAAGPATPAARSERH